ncbi:MAG: hypothetical protein NVS3B20_19260 [Polyangiales bacterium]
MRVTVPAATEIFRCQLVRLPKVEGGHEMFLNGHAHDYTPGSHHFLLFRTDLNQIAPGLDQPFDCAEGGGVMRHAGGYVFGGQVPHLDESYPEGVALALRSEEVLVLQAHYINASKNALEAKVDLTLKRVDEASVKHRAGLIRMYDPFIYVAPKSGGTAQMRCPIKKDMTILAASPHMHARGMNHTTWFDAAMTTPTDKPLFVSTDWEHPADYKGSFPATKGSAFRFQCTYKNESDRPFVQGQSADTNEMCMLTALYYPALETDDQFCYGDQYGAGTQSCSDTLTCIQGCPANSAPTIDKGNTAITIGECWQKCLTTSCPNASRPFLDVIDCIGAKCKTECGPSGDCKACVASNCGTEYLTCANLACDKK